MAGTPAAAASAWYSRRKLPTLQGEGSVEGRGVDRIISVTGLSLSAMPEFVTGIVLIVVFGVFGSLVRIKRVTVALLAFAEIRRRWPQARLVIAGHASAPDIVAEVRQTIAQLGVSGSVRLALSPDKPEFEELITATDAVINLRWPTAGETSAVMMRTASAAV